MNLYPVLRIVSSQAEKYNIGSLCLPPLLRRGMLLLQNSVQAGNNGFLFSCKRAGFFLLSDCCHSVESFL